MLYMIRLKVFASSEKKLSKASKALACSSFIKATKNVKAYRDFVSSSKKKPKNFSTIPFTTKDNYIKEYTQKKHFGELSLYKGGVIPKGSKKDTSTGTSGKPTSWYRGPKEIAQINRSIALSAKAVIGNTPYYLINGFALGPWATGVTIATGASSDPNATVCNIGLNTKEIFQAIKDATKVIPKEYPLIITGYPPHLKEVVDLAIEEGFPLENYNIIGIVGGESMSETQRSLINCQKDKQGKVTRTGFRHCYSAYGASDLDVAIGYETDFALELRQALHKNPLLAKELLGENEFVPMIFPYDPLNYLIETDKEQNLAFTCVRGDRISPRIRYNLGDRGKTMPLSDVLAILKKHNIKIDTPPKTRLPLLFVWGRVGSQITFQGLNMAPENLEDALRSSNYFSEIAHYGFLQYEEQGNPITEILIEKTDKATFTNEQIHKEVITGLKKYNQEFNKLMNENATPPRLRTFKKGEGPMALQKKRYPHRKIQYIFRKGDEFVPTMDHIQGTVNKLLNT